MDTEEFERYMASGPTAYAFYRDMIYPRIELGRLPHSSIWLEMICNLPMQGGVYVGEERESDVFIEDWNVSSPELLHRHPEFGWVRTAFDVGTVEVDTTDGKCDLCHKEISGELAMIHKFHQL
jgi:hypothetical protein